MKMSKLLQLPLLLSLTISLTSKQHPESGGLLPRVAGHEVYEEEVGGSEAEGSEGIVNEFGEFEDSNEQEIAQGSAESEKRAEMDEVPKSRIQKVIDSYPVVKFVAEKI